MSVILYSLGAAQEVTGSKHILEIDGRAFMIDQTKKTANSRFRPKNSNRLFSRTRIMIIAVFCPLLPNTGFLAISTRLRQRATLQILS